MGGSLTKRVLVRLSALGMALGLVLSVAAPIASAEPDVEVYDTSWTLPLNSTAAEVEQYFAHQEAVGLAGVWVSLAPKVWEGGLAARNRQGHAFQSFDDPNPSYLAHVDTILDTAQAHGRKVGLVVAWGTDWVGARPGAVGNGDSGPAPLHPDNAFAYGRTLGRRWADHPALAHWVMGGDWWDPTTEAATEPTWTELVRGLEAAGVDRDRQPITYHTGAYLASLHLFSNRDWVDVLAPNTGPCRSPAETQAWMNGLQRYGKEIIASEMSYEAMTITWCPGGNYVVSATHVEDDARAAFQGGARTVVIGHLDRARWSNRPLAALGSPGERRVLDLVSQEGFGTGRAPRPGDATLGLVDPLTGLWTLGAGTADGASFFYGAPGDVPLVGDWDCDGFDTPGMYRPSNGFVYLRNSSDFGVADAEFFFGLAGDIPLVGDWNGDGCDTLAVYRAGQVLARNELGTGAAETSFYFGERGDRPFSGDFDGDGVDSVGLYRRSTGFLYFRNELTSGVAESSFFFGNPSDRIVTGDWDGDGIDTFAAYRPSELSFYLADGNTASSSTRRIVIDGGGWPVAGRFGL